MCIYLYREKERERRERERERERESVFVCEGEKSDSACESVCVCLLAPTITQHARMYVHEATKTQVCTFECVCVCVCVCVLFCDFFHGQPIATLKVISDDTCGLRTQVCTHTCIPYTCMYMGACVSNPYPPRLRQNRPSLCGMLFTLLNHMHCFGPHI